MTAIHEIAPGVFRLHAPAATEDAVEQAWQRFRALAAQAQEYPHLRDDPAHKAKREAAHAEFKRLFEGWAG